MSIFKARVEYEVTDTSVKTYSFPFPYLRKEFIKVSILHTDNSVTALTYGVDYSVDDLTLTLVTSPSVSEHLIIYRETTTDKIITWNDGSILLAKDMNTEDAQMLHLQEEQKDYLLANALATSVTDTKETIWSAQNHRVTDVSDPKEPQDAVTKHYMESVQDGFVSRNTSLLEQATTQATNAKNSASSSATSASQSASSASASETSNQSAKKWAESTASPDNQADTDSTTGETQSSRSWALYSKSKAQEAATSATNAKASETNAKTSETKAATSEANAKASETNAKSSETKSKDSENAARVYEQNAAESARVATENAMDFNMLKRNKAYSIGDIAYSSYLPSWARLECVKAGTTGATVPPALGTTHIAGQYITDGTSIFVLDDVRDGVRVGDIVLKPTLNDGYIKANGAIVKASEYPRLLKFAQDNNLCVSDSEWNDNSATKYVYDESEDSLKVPNVVGRVLQGGNELITKSAGLPNITGTITFRTINKSDPSLILDSVINPTGPFYKTTKNWSGTHDALSVSACDTYEMEQLNMDASRSNSVYGNSDTVQPPACCLIAQIKY